MISLSTKSNPCLTGCLDVYAELLIILCDMSLTEMGQKIAMVIAKKLSQTLLCSPAVSQLRLSCRCGDPDLRSLILQLDCYLYVSQLVGSQLECICAMLQSAPPNEYAPYPAAINVGARSATLSGCIMLDIIRF